jgi:hypothetical protein
MRILTTAVLAAVAVAAAAVAPITGSRSADACAGLIGSNGAANLGRTTTLAGYHNGVEHYVTAFEFAGGGGEFGTLIPLPGVPTNVERGGDWTLQRLQRETQLFEGDAFRNFEAPADTGAIVLQEVRIDALDITVLKGGAPDVAAWATDHGFRLSPDAPEVLDFYAQRSPIFLAAVFDGEAAAQRGQQLGDGTPVHLTIPTDNPWVPLRILGLGKQQTDFVQADVFLLTDDRPALLHGAGITLAHSQPANDLLLSDLRTDKGGDWVPGSAWLTKLAVDAPASDLNYDLAIDTSGANSPSEIAAFGLGLEIPDVGPAEDSSSNLAWALTAAAAFALLLMVAARLRVAGVRPWAGRR